MPRRASALFGDSGWLARFAEGALADGDRLVTGFLALFEGQLDLDTPEQLREFATRRLKERAGQAAQAWEGRLADLRARLRAIDAAYEAKDLPENDRAAQRYRRQLWAERDAVAR